METINDKNYELWLVRYAEGDLTAAERQAVEVWLEGHPDAVEELALYQEAPRLQRDDSVHYAGAATPQAGQVRPLWSAVLRLSVAAAILVALAVPAVRWLAPQGQPVEVAQVKPEVIPDRVDDSLTVPVEAPAVERKSVVAVRPQPEAAPLLAEAVEEAAPEEVAPEMPQFELEPLVAEAEDEEPVQEDEVIEAVEEELPLVYVDNLFVADSGDAIEQRLLIANGNAKERLQGTYLGRRLARRLPSDDELLAYTGNLRDRMPRSIRMMADMVLAYNDSNR